MVNGKVKLNCSDKTTSSRECPICGAGPKQMNMSAAEVSEISSDVDEDILAMGLSTMHGWLKSNVVSPPCHHNNIYWIQVQCQEE